MAYSICRIDTLGWGCFKVAPMQGGKESSWTWRFIKVTIAVEVSGCDRSVVACGSCTMLLRAVKLRPGTLLVLVWAHYHAFTYKMTFVNASSWQQISETRQ